MIRAEGTAQLRPTSSDLYGNVQVNDVSRPFALESNTDTLHRLYIHIKSTSEKIYFGFQPLDNTLGHGTYRIKDPNGNIVTTAPRANVPVASGQGYIDTYAQAVAGPKIGGSPAGGYNPFELTPATTGDYYIEFTTTLGAAYHFILFDITVVDASNNPIPGRLWSYAWDLNTQGATNPVYMSFYIYTKDQYISAVDVNGMEPWGFVVSSNSTGTGNTGNVTLDRQSVSGNSTSPQFKEFLNNPDPAVYPVATIPTMITNLKILNSPVSGSNVLFYLNMNKSGTVEIFLDLDGVAGYQSGGKDVALAQTIKAGGDTIIWNGKDGLGATVLGSVTVEVTSRFSTGVTHFPIYDDEYLPNGYIVSRIAPISDNPNVYWDDVQIGGTTQLTGVSGTTNEHNFPVFSGGYGNNRTVNTWWNGYENDNLSSFSFSMNGALPIELSLFTATNVDANVKLAWTTQTETNNDYFTLEKSSNGVDWQTIYTCDGVGTSTIVHNYSYTDTEPFNGINYYRLLQTDINGQYTYSSIESIVIKNEDIVCMVFPNPGFAEDITVIVKGITVETASISIDDMSGRHIYSGSAEVSSSQVVIKLTDICNNIRPGTYYISIQCGDIISHKKFIVE